MLVSLGVENFRSFKNKTNIELKPITVLVGKNSCGKSSFLRLFPLFRQSIEAHTTGPILWFGRYVDFGDFNNVLFKDSENKQIKFHFNVKLSYARDEWSIFLHEKNLTDEVLNVAIELSIEADGQKTKYKKIKVFFDTFEISIEQESNKLIKYSIIDSNNNIEEFESTGTFFEKTNVSHVLPLIQFKKDLDKGREAIWPGDVVIDDYFFHHHSRNNSHFREAYEVLKKYFSEQTQPSTVWPLLSDIDITQINKIKLYDYLKKTFRKQTVFIRNLDKYYQTIYKEIAPKLLLANLNSLLRRIDNNLNNTFSNIRYIAPIRAIAERFYRFQDLQVNEMDHTGSNMAMLLNSLNKTDKTLFEKWVKENFNFSVAVEESGSHYTINIIDENNTKYNISDMGFGYSQLLPIIMSLWLETEKKESKRRRASNELFFVIEQPELHLHPAYQTKLALLFSNIIAKASQYNIKIIVETHSQYFINALGESVEKKLISKDDVSIIIFNKKNKETDVQTAYFDEDGTLENWPIGFFSGE